MVSRFLHRSSSKPGGRPPREPVRRRAAWLSVFSGIVCRMPRRRRYARQGPLLWALSAARLSELVRGRPAPVLGRGLPQDRLELGAVRPLAWCDGGRERGRQRPSALRWSLLVNPPCERPRPSPPPVGRLQALPRGFALVFWHFGPFGRGCRR